MVVLALYLRQPTAISPERIGRTLNKLLKSLPLACALLLAVPSAMAADSRAAAHKAIYKMTLVSAKNTSIVSVDGQMYYDFTDTCDAWSSDQKFALNYVYADEPEARMNTQFSSHESKNGNSYDFAVRRSKNDNLEEQFVGSATRKEDGSGAASFTEPDKRELSLPKDFFFPTQHTDEIIRHAQAGDHIFNSQIFDGSDGTPAVEVNVVIGNVIKPDVNDKLAGNALLQSPARKVRLAFFQPDDKKGKSEDDEAEPDYEMTMILHENGIVSWMQIDYDQFSLRGELEAIEAVPRPKC